MAYWAVMGLMGIVLLQNRESSEIGEVGSQVAAGSRRMVQRVVAEEE